MKFIITLFVLLSLTACSSWVYKYDIVQGNYLNQDDVDKLRINMSREQVAYVLGEPVIKSPFRQDKWHYVYTVKSGVTDKTSRKELVIVFANNQLVEVQGDFELSEKFNQPIDSL